MSIELGQCRLVYRQYFPFWEKLTDEQRELLCANTGEFSYKKGTNIHGTSGNCTGAIMVISGTLRAYLLSENGKEITLYRYRPGEVCMLSASCVLRSITFDVIIDAEEDSSVYIVRGDVMAKVAEDNLFVANYAFFSLDKRIAVFLWDEFSRTGSDTLSLTHEQIARYISSAREAVTRMLKYFAAEGIVELSRKGIKISDREKLRELATGE